MVLKAKAFFSHSSKDKSLINDVAKLLPQARLEIDSLSFEHGKTSASEITKSISRSQLFVLFASKEVLESEWIKSEIEIAQQQYFKNQIRGILVFILDDIPIKAVGDWLRTFVVMRSKNALRISNTIKSKLIQIDASNNLIERPFVPRNSLNEEFYRKLANLSNPTTGIYISGVEGIGRKTFVSNALTQLYPSADVIGINVPVFDGEGLLEAYFKIFSQWNNPSNADLAALYTLSSDMSYEEISEKFLVLLNEIGETKSFVWLQFDNSATNEEGEIEPQFLQILQNIESNRPTLIIRARKSPKITDQRKTPNIAYIKVQSLTAEESKRLWIYALKFYQVEPINSQMIDYLCEQISGHPNLIWMAAEYVAVTGLLAIQANLRMFTESLEKLSMSLIDGLPLSDSAKKVLALFDEFGTISLEDLQIVFGADSDEQDLADAVTSLVSYSLLEMDETHFKIAPYFQHTRFRKSFSVEVDPFLDVSRKRLLDVVNTYSVDESVSFSTIDSTILSAIKLNEKLPFGFDEKAIVGSHYLRLARSYYDRQNYVESTNFARKAFDKEYTLTDSAKNEALRLLGISAIRIGNGQQRDFAIENLVKLDTIQSKRHIAFIKGFDARYNNNFDIAEQFFREVLTYSPNDNHALRELSQILVHREEYGQAESFSRQVLQRTQENPYLIDILLKCLIELKKSDINVLRDDEEISSLLLRLKIADSREKSSFFPLRNAQYLAALKNYTEALEAADEAVATRKQPIHALATRAEIKMAINYDKNVLVSALDDIQQIQKISNANTENKKHLSLITKLRIRYELALSNHKTALAQYDKTSFLLGKFRKTIGLEIAYKIIEDGVNDTQLIDWANKFLEGNK